MAAETRHAGLTADERSTIRSTVLKARETIENDLYRQLERYGVYDDERVDIDALGHLNAYDKQTRSQIDAALDRELEATDDDYERSVKNYVREATKTYLNRLVALKTIEVRGLVTETMVKRPEYGNRSEMHRTVDEVAGELTDQSDNGLGVAVELAFTELTDEIGVIFEESEHTAIDLDFTVREEVIEQLNAIDESVWESDEAMGWVYQYFGENEREEIDDRIDEENYKVQDTDVATKTQLFTPRYIVEWMVDNSLGRLWLEMYGEETDIDDEDNCFYLSPLEESLVDRDVKDVRDIKVLDPACGSGHMLFYAFDVLYEMYLEQGDVAEKYIPREILANNLYGIDIDPGAAQLAALALYVKAKNVEPDVEIEGINIVSADAVLVNGEKKEEVLSRTESNLERKVLEQVWTSFEHIREWGSLVRIEERIEEIIDEELEEVAATGQTKFTDDGLAKQSSVVSYSGEEESWEQVKERLMDQVSELAEEGLERHDPVGEMFAGEVEKSVHILDIFLHDFDTVITNPPYLGSAKMSQPIKNYIKENYLGTRDLYTAFIERCGEFASQDSYVSMVTPESFMFLKSYRDLRSEIIEDQQFIEGVHLSGHGFDIGDRPYTIPFILRNKDPSVFEHSRFYRMTHKQEKYSTFSDKKRGLTEITNTSRKNQSHDDSYIVDQNAFLEIGNTPFIYWYGKEVLSIFIENDSFSEYMTTQSGIKSGNNTEFLRKWWEVPSSEISERYVPLVRSENNIGYYDQTTYTIDWKDDGDYIQDYCSEHGHQCFFGDKTKLGEECIAFQDINRKQFAARKIPEGYYCDIQLFTVYPNEEIDLDSTIGFLNSSLVRFIMDGLNPTMHFKQGDIKRVPFIQLEREEYVSKLVSDIISQIKRKVKLREATIYFDPEHFFEQFEGESLAYSIQEMLLDEDLIEADRYVIQGLIDNIVFDSCNMSESTQEYIYDNVPRNVANFAHLSNSGDIKDGEQDFRSEIPIQEVEKKEYIKTVDTVNEFGTDDMRSVSEELEISPYTVALMRYEEGLYTDGEKDEIVSRLLSYYLGVLFGRWEGLSQEITRTDDGILIFDKQFNSDIHRGIQKCMKHTFDDPYEAESEIEAILGRGPTEWLHDRFFRHHHTKEYRRRGQRIPIYWQLESDDGAFSCFVYYHSMDSDTFPKLRGQYIDEKLDTLQNRLEAIESELDTVEGDRARELRSEKEEVQAEIEDVSEFRDRVDTLIDEGFEPDFGAGIWENIQKVDEHDLLAVPLDKL